MSYFWNYADPSFSNYNFTHRTWNTDVTCKVYINTPDDGFYAYQIKYFYHTVGGSDTGHFSSWQVAHVAGEANTYEVTVPLYNCQADQSYVIEFRLWYYTNGMQKWQESKTTTPYTTNIQIKKPLFQWQWNPSDSNFSGSWIDVNASGLREDLTSSNNALHTGGETRGFKRTIWNQMINWMINTYNAATGESRNESWFNPNVTAYMSLDGDGVFKADHWNSMRNIANAAARALGYNNFLNIAVKKGDELKAQIFKDVTTTLNTYIIGYAT